ncbi:MAG: hypothetical protein SPI71_05450 [Acidaminococcaceae bacterium]|nr:hypothetical protein [Acidaminococcaceae bacterium]
MLNRRFTHIREKNSGARGILNKLYNKIFVEKLIIYTEIKNMKQGDALEMFVRFNSGGKVVWFVVGSVLPMDGFIIPALIKKYGDKVFIESLNTDGMDFDDMELEIVPF